MQSLEKRLTHKYVGTWQHEDKWEPIGSFDEIGSRELPQSEKEEYDICEPHARKVFVLVELNSDAHERWIKSPDYSPETGAYDAWLNLEIEGALRDTFTQWGCDHEYDCCGCRSYSAGDVERVTGDLWSVNVHSSRNF